MSLTRCYGYDLLVLYVLETLVWFCYFQELFITVLKCKSLWLLDYRRNLTESKTTTLADAPCEYFAILSESERIGVTTCDSDYLLIGQVADNFWSHVTSWRIFYLH